MPATNPKKMLWTITLLIFYINALSSCGAYRILGVFIHPGKSHVDSFIPIFNRLTQRGHDVTVLSYYQYPYANYTELQIEGVPSEFYTQSIGFDQMNLPSRSLYTQIEEFFELRYWADPICDFALNSPSIDKILQIHKSHPFDLLVLEQFNTDCMLVLPHKMNIPYVSISSCALFAWHYDNFGLPGFPSYIPTHSAGLSANMGVYERSINWLAFMITKRLYRLRQLDDNKVIGERFGPGIPDVAEIAKQTTIMLVHQHYSLHGPKPLSPAVIEIGGSHIREEAALPLNIREFIENSEHGVIVISWGSAIKASSIDPNKVKDILKALGKLHENIIWKWETENIQNKPKNVLIQKWLPQRDLLCHPKVKAFWSHGGNLGSNEAAYCGVPVIVTPIYGDQFLNGNAFIDRNMGLVLPYVSINEYTVLSALNDILQKRYLENAKIVSFAYRNRPISPVDTAAWWIEHIASGHTDTLIRSHSSEMCWIAYYSVDVLLILFAVSFTVLCSFFIGIRKMCCRKKTKPTKKLKKK